MSTIHIYWQKSNSFSLSKIVVCYACVLLPSPFSFRVGVSVWVLSMNKIELLVSNGKSWNQITVCKQMNFYLFKNVTYKLFAYKSLYIYIYIYIMELALNNLQVFICHKTQPTNHKFSLSSHKARSLRYPVRIILTNNGLFLVGRLCLWYINLWRLFNAKSIFIQIVLFQIIQFSINAQFNCQKHFYLKLFILVKQFSNSKKSIQHKYAVSMSKQFYFKQFSLG